MVVVVNVVNVVVMKVALLDEGFSLKIVHSVWDISLDIRLSTDTARFLAT